MSAHRHEVMVGALDVEGLDGDTGSLQRVGEKRLEIGDRILHRLIAGGIVMEVKAVSACAVSITEVARLPGGVDGGAGEFRFIHHDFTADCIDSESLESCHDLGYEIIGLGVVDRVDGRVAGGFDDDVTLDDTVIDRGVEEDRRGILVVLTHLAQERGYGDTLHN